MEPIPKSGYYYPNKAARITLELLESFMGKNGLNTILNLAHLPDLINNYPPQDLERQFDFADFAAISWAVEEIYGARGGHGLDVRAGKAIFAQVLCDYGALAGMENEAFKVLPLSTKLKIGLPTIARIISQISDQHSTVEEREQEYIYTVHRCPQCWGRSGLDKPICYMGAGLLQEGLKWLSGGHEFRLSETQCMATGDPACEYTIQKLPVS
jgi:predicted hydrocarbon binding protein